MIATASAMERFASAGGAINVLVDRLLPLEAPDELAGEVRELELPAPAEEREEAPKVAAGGGGDFRAVAPPVLSFTNGRSR